MVEVEVIPLRGIISVRAVQVVLPPVVKRQMYVLLPACIVDT
jgi:hypothetical protein